MLSEKLILIKSKTLIKLRTSKRFAATLYNKQTKIMTKTYSKKKKRNNNMCKLNYKNS